MKQDNKKQVKNAPMTEDEIDRVIDLKLFKAFRLLEEHNILYFRVLKRLSILIETNFPAIGAVAYSRQLSKTYMILQKEAMLRGSVEDIAGLAEHECGHVFYEHLFIDDNISNKKDHDTLNQAQDYIINDSCHYIKNRMKDIESQNSESILKGGCFYKRLQLKFPQLQNRSSDDVSSSYLYDLLYKNKKEQEKQNKAQNAKGKGQPQSGSGSESQESDSDSQGQGQGESQGKSSEKKKNSKGSSGQGSDDSQENSQDSQVLGKNLDSHDEFEVKQDKETGQITIENLSKKKNEQEEKKQTEKAAKTQKRIDENNRQQEQDFKDLLAEVIEQLKRDGLLDKAIGQLPGELKFLIQGMVKSKLNKNVVLDFTNRLVQGTKKTWAVLNPRYPYVAKGKLKSRKPKLGVVIDTSGSMNEPEVFEMINYQCKMLMHRCESLYFIIGDTRLQNWVLVKRKNDFKADTLKFSGLGGTDLQFGWDFAKEHKLDGLIVHTDGAIGSFDDRGIKTIFFLYTSSKQHQKGYKNYEVNPA